MKIKIVKISNIQGSAKKFLTQPRNFSKKYLLFGQILEVDQAKNFSIVAYICQNWGEKLLIANVSQINSVYQVPGSVKQDFFFLQFTFAYAQLLLHMLIPSGVYTFPN